MISPPTMRKRRKVLLLLGFLTLVALIYMMAIGAKSGAGGFIGGTKGRFLSFVRSGISTQDRLDTADLLGFNDRWVMVVVHDFGVIICASISPEDDH